MVTAFAILAMFFFQLVGLITPTISVLNPVLPLPLRMIILRAVTNIVAPLFYIGAAEKEKLKKVRLLCFRQNNVHPSVPQMYPVME